MKQDSLVYILIKADRISLPLYIEGRMRGWFKQSRINNVLLAKIRPVGKEPTMEWKFVWNSQLVTLEDWEADYKIISSLPSYYR